MRRPSTSTLVLLLTHGLLLAFIFALVASGNAHTRQMDAELQKCQGSERMSITLMKEQAAAMRLLEGERAAATDPATARTIERLSHRVKDAMPSLVGY